MGGVSASLHNTGDRYVLAEPDIQQHFPFLLSDFLLNLLLEANPSRTGLNYFFLLIEGFLIFSCKSVDLSIYGSRSHSFILMAATTFL